MTEETCRVSASASSASSSPASSEWVAIGTEAELREKGRKTVSISGRKVTAFYRNGGYHVIDFHCYHAGGPLDIGNIEDINGISCIVCPWHKFKISLVNGESFYQSIDPKNPKEPPCWKSKGVKQRTHSVKIGEDGMVYVMLSTDTTIKYASDHYYSKEYQALMNFAEDDTK